MSEELSSAARARRRGLPGWDAACVLAWLWDRADQRRYRTCFFPTYEVALMGGRTPRWALLQLQTLIDDYLVELVEMSFRRDCAWVCVDPFHQLETAP